VQRSIESLLKLLLSRKSAGESQRFIAWYFDTRNRAPGEMNSVCHNCRWPGGWTRFAIRTLLSTELGEEPSWWRAGKMAC